MAPLTAARVAWRLAPWVAVAALVAVVQCQGERAGRDREVSRRAALEADSLRRMAARVDTQYVRDTLWLRRAARAYDSARVTDTLWRDSVVYVPRDVADAAIDACRAVVATCEERVALRDARLAAQARELAAALDLRSAPQWSVGAEWAPEGLGGYVERDVWRFRLGATVTPGRVGLRVGWRW